MNLRSSFIKQIQESHLDDLCGRYGISKDSLALHPEYDGCQNIIFYCTIQGAAYVLRISFRPDRTLAHLLAEVDFVRYLFEHGAPVCPPVASRDNNLVERLSVSGRELYAVVFLKAPGIRLPDNGYRYRDGVPLTEYYTNYGKTLGLLHRLSKSYVASANDICRPDWLQTMRDEMIASVLPVGKTVLRNVMRSIRDQALALPQTGETFGLLHADFGDGNFTIDYANGEITVFDFNDCAYGLFLYDLADAWTKGVGWAQFERTPEARREKMNSYFNSVLSGYAMENTLPADWEDRLPLFVKVVEMEALLGEYQRAMATGEQVDEADEELAYRIKCLEEEIPFMGFFDPVYSPDAPFCLS
jgi:Ser/Thr protein kinase RdoA (MazF antagonist)